MLSAPMALIGATASDASAAAGSSTLRPGETLYRGQSLVNGQYTLAMQSDGNFVLYGRGRALWQTQTYRTGGASVSMQGDGNLVVYNAASRALWQSGTAGHGGSRLELQTDGNAVVYSPANQALWATNTWAPATTTRSLTVCDNQKTAVTNWDVYQVCLTGTDSFNGSQSSGYVSSSTCQVFLPTGAGLVCDGFTRGSYRTSAEIWEDWLNYRVSYISPYFPFRASYSDCVYLRVDTAPNGATTTQNFANRTLPWGTVC